MTQRTGLSDGIKEADRYHSAKLLSASRQIGLCRGWEAEALRAREVSSLYWFSGFAMASAKA